MIPFAEYCLKATGYIERHYGLRIALRDVPPPFIGDLNGAEIHIHRSVSSEKHLFLLAHLFGHSVQWNVSPETIEIGQQRKPPVAESLLPPIMAYEREAAAYALTMLNESGIRGIEQWLSDWTACDIAYLGHFYRTGEKLEFSYFRLEDTALLTPKPIPAFTPRKLEFRRDGIVI